MASRTPYCVVTDVLRRFDPTYDRSDLATDNDLFQGDDIEVVNSHIEDACDEFDRRTNNPQRLTRAGRGDAWEYHDAELRRHQGGMKVYLDHRNVLPFDSAEGDVIEIRTNRDSWRDLTTSTDRWRLNAADGILQVFTRRVALVGRHRRAMISDNIRLKYRFGALGGTRDRPGQTTLDGSVTQGDASISVADASRLPPAGTVLIDREGDNDPEYVRVSSADTSTDVLTVASRGLRGTADQDHGDGADVHFCDMGIRKAVAGRAATELVRSDDFTANLAPSDDSVSFQDRIDSWTEEWDDILGRYSEARML